jgi:Holliday junction resolvase-like predicted endonuclease
MVVTASVKDVPLQHTTRTVTSTDAVLNKKVMKPAKTAKNFLAQSSFNSATILFGFITCQ